MMNYRLLKTVSLMRCACMVLLLCISSNSLYAQGYVEHSRVLGAGGNDQFKKIIADAGNSYLLQWGTVNTFPVTIGTVPTGTGTKGRLIKLDPSGNMIWSRYLPEGGSGNTIYEMMELHNGLLYLLGTSTVTTVPVTDGSVAGGGGYDILYTKIDATNGALLHNGYMGGSGSEDRGLNLAIENGAAFITYSTTSADIPITTGPAFTSGFDRVVTKLNTSDQVQYSTYTGSVSATVANTEQVSMAIENGILWMGMVVNTVNSFSTIDGSTVKGTYDFGLLQLDANGNRLYSTVFGGTGIETQPQLVVQNGDVYLSGYTNSTNFPVTDGSSKSPVAQGLIFTKYTANGFMQYSGYRGGLGIAASLPLIRYDAGSIYLMGANHPGYADIAVTDGSNGGSYLIKINAATGAVQFATEFGAQRNFAIGTGTDFLIEDGFIYTVTPILNASAVPTTDGTVRSPNGGGFITRHTTNGELVYASFVLAAGFGGHTDIAFSNGKLYIGGDALFSSIPTTMPALGTPTILDVYWSSIAFCPPMPTNQTIGPLVQTICSQGFTEVITGNSVAYPSSSMPILYRNGVAYPQTDIRARYQWQSADASTGPWVNIAGIGTQKDFSPPTGAANKYYRRLVLAPKGCLPELVSTSDVAAVMVSADSSPEVATSIYNTCVGTAVNILATATGGTTPYSYAWDNGIVDITNAVTVTPLSNSVYTVTVTDANGCQQIGQTIVNAFSADAGNASASICAGQPIRIGTAPPAGLAGVVYEWLPAIGLNDAAISQPLANGSVDTMYTLSMTIPVTGGGTCTTTDSIAVQVVTGPTANFAGANLVLCKSGSGTIGSPAEPGFSYAWSSGNYLSTTSAATVTFDAGSELPMPNPFNYTLYATSNGCTFSDAVRVSVLQADAGPDYCGPRTIGNADPVPGVNDKTILWEVVSGPGTITGATNTYQTTVSASIGAPTVYRLTLTLDGVSCSDLVTVDDCGVVLGCVDPEIKVIASNTCPGAQFGSVVLSALPSTLPTTEWSYNWSSSTGTGISSTTGTSITLTDNVEKDVTLTITNLDNPLVSCSETIHVNDPLWVLPTFSAPDQTICPGTNISIGLPAVPGYSYLWTGVEAAQNTLSNPSITPINTTNFQVVVKDATSGCTVTDSVLVTIKNLVNDPGPDWTACSNAMLTLGSPALPDYTYSWAPIVAGYQNGTDHLSAEPEVLVAISQDFTLTVTDTITGCSSDSTIQITIDDGSTLTPMTDVTICKSGDGAIIGNQALTGVTYSWAPAAGLSSTSVAQPLANPLVTTVYTLTVSFFTEDGSAACTKSGTVTVTVNQPEITLSDDAVCPSDALYNLSTGVTVTGAVSYAWSPSVLVTSPNVLSTTVKANPNVPTTFTLTATDANGCSISASKIVSPVNAAPIAGSNAILCLGSNIVLGDASNTGILSWSVTPAIAGTMSTTSGATTVFTPAAADLGKTFTFSVTQDIAGCIGTADANVIVRGFQLDSIPVQTVCNNASAVIGLPAAGGYSYEWSPATGLSDPYASTTVVNNITTTSVYTLNATDIYGCTGSTQATVAVNPTPAPAINIPDITVMLGTPPPAFDPQVVGTSAPYTYTWSPAATLDNPYIANATASAGGVGTTTYSLQVTDANGCTSTATVNLEVEPYNVLPVKITSFYAMSRDCNVFLHWNAAVSEGFDYFEVERSNNGISFQPIARIAYSDQTTSFSFEDVKPGNAQWYYRLKLVDIDGKFSFSALISSSANCIENSAITIYPNPVHDMIYIKSEKVIKKGMLISISGQMIMQYNPAQTVPGTYSIPLSPMIPKGIYILQLLNSDGTISNSKLIKN